MISPAKPPSKRALELDAQVMRIRSEIRKKWLAMGRVLSEIQETLAYRELGFSNFQQYVEARLGISSRWANYLVCMVRKAKRFGIRNETIAKLDISKSLEIFRLDDPGKAEALVRSTIRQDTSLKEVKRQVALAMGRAAEGEPKTVRKVWYFSEPQWSVIRQAIKAVQLIADCESETYALELIAADYLAGIGLEEDMKDGS